MDKLVIVLEPWEAEKLNTALKHLLKTHLECPEHLIHITDDSFMAVAWLIAWRHHIFDKEKNINMNLPTEITEYL